MEARIYRLDGSTVFFKNIQAFHYDDKKNFTIKSHEKDRVVFPAGTLKSIQFEEA